MCIRCSIISHAEGDKYRILKVSNGAVNFVPVFWKRTIFCKFFQFLFVFSFALIIVNNFSIASGWKLKFASVFEKVSR